MFQHIEKRGSTFCRSKEAKVKGKVGFWRNPQTCCVLNKA